MTDFHRGDQVLHISCGRGIVIGTVPRRGGDPEVTVRFPNYLGGQDAVIETRGSMLKLARLIDLDELQRRVITGLKARGYRAERHHSGGGIEGVLILTPSGLTELFGTYREDFTDVLCYDVFAARGGDWEFSVENDRVKLPATAEEIITGSIALIERLK